MLLEIENVKKTYRERGKAPVHALQGVSFSIPQGGCRGIVGESGCGKSTLLRIISGIEKPDEGEVRFLGEPLPYTGKFSNRHALQMVFQNSLDAVVPYQNAVKIVSEPLRNFFHLSSAECDAKVAELFQLVGLDPRERYKYPYQFSGGQLQRICIARALAAEPKLLLLDEPLSSLDVSVQAQILNLLLDLKSSLNLTYLLVSHDLEAVYYLSDSLTVMYNGYVMENLEDIAQFNELAHPYSLRLLHASYGYRGNQEERLDSLSLGEAVQKGCPYAGKCSMAKDICRTSVPKLTEVQRGHFVACHSLTYGV